MRAEESVKRLRKPEGAAKSGQVNPARQRCQSLLASMNVEGHRTSWEGLPESPLLAPTSRDGGSSMDSARRKKTLNAKPRA